MILGHEESKIVKLAVENQSEMTDGVVQYNYEDGKFFGAGFTTGTLENPANPFLEVFRLRQGEDGKIDYNCDDCPFRNGFDDEKHRRMYPSTREECCIDAYIDNDFDYDFENNFRESVEQQVREVLSDHLGETISQLNEIRIQISDRLKPYNYMKVRNDNWEMIVLDSYVDYAMDDGFTTQIKPNDYLYANIQHLADVRYMDNEDKEFWQKVGTKIEECDFDGALELLQ